MLELEGDVRSLQYCIRLEGKNMRVNITLECTDCKERNYITKKNKRNNPDRLEVKKYCPRERRVTLHRETK